ncbi:MAG TPA: hypothetical protein VGK19_19580 [Capsulimonadaceae bacterium]
MDEPVAHTAQEPGTSSDAVWPPPPNIAPTATVRFGNNYLKSRGYTEIDRKRYRGSCGFPPERGGLLSDFRTGTLSVGEDGISIEGRAVASIEIQFWTEVVLFFACLWLVPVVCFEASRFAKTLPLRWTDIDEIVFVPKRHMICVVYHQASERQMVRQFSLASHLSASDYDAFVKAVYANAPASTTIVADGKLNGANSALAYSVAVGWVLVITASMVNALLTSLAGY